jgi:hypothetical protein
MTRSIALAVSVLFLLFSAVACGGPDDDLRGWKQSDVEIVSEGAATGTTSRIVTPGDAPGGGTVALTSTDIDTTGLLETIPQDTLPDYDDEGSGTLADRLGVAREDGTMPPVRSYPTTTTTTTTTRPATAAPQTTTARPQPSAPSTRTTTAPATTTRTAEPVREQRESEGEPREREPSRSEEPERTEAPRPAEPADPPAEQAPPAQESSPDEERRERQPPPEDGERQGLGTRG